MQTKKLSNGLKIIYEKSINNLFSICIGLEAGANSEKIDEIGCAHALEHLVYKGTKDFSEKQINEKLDSIFGFNNAMTNYPYVVYYGSCFDIDFEQAIHLFSQLIMYPKLINKGYKEEMNVIQEELNEWKDDPNQLCEDLLLLNSYDKKRVKWPIIGTRETIDEISLEKIKGFYYRNYIPEKCTISIVSSLVFEDIVEVVEKYFFIWKNENINNYLNGSGGFSTDEENIKGLFISNNNNLNGVKFNYLFSIDNLSDIEIQALKILNYKLGTGINSLLYDSLRTEKGLVYDISSRVHEEKRMKYLIIKGGTSFEKIDDALQAVNQVLDRFKNEKDLIDNIDIEKVAKSMELSNMINNEMSIRLAMKMTVNEIMFDDYSKAIKVIRDNKVINKTLLKRVLEKVFSSPSIQILK